MPNKTTKFLVLFIAVAVLTAMVHVPVLLAKDVPRLSIDDLKGMLDNQDTIVLDVRTGRDWSASEFKIKGAQRFGGDDFDQWSDTLPKDKTLVLYCA